MTVEKTLNARVVLRERSARGVILIPGGALGVEVVADWVDGLDLIGRLEELDGEALVGVPCLVEEMVSLRN